MWIADRPKKKQEGEDLATRDGLSAMRRCMGARVHDSTYTCMMYAHVQVSTASEIKGSIVDRARRQKAGGSSVPRDGPSLAVQTGTSVRACSDSC